MAQVRADDAGVVYLVGFGPQRLRAVMALAELDELDTDPTWQGCVELHMDARKRSVRPKLRRDLDAPDLRKLGHVA